MLVSLFLLIPAMIAILYLLASSEKKVLPYLKLWPFQNCIR